MGIATLISLIAIGAIGAWSQAMITLALVLTALLFCVAIGLPMGIWLARSPRAAKIIRPLLDAMQTTPAFVYLVPIVMLFGIGNVPGVVVTIIFALPPIIRLTILGINQVPADLIEASRSFGASPRQMLFKVQLPLAMQGKLLDNRNKMLKAQGINETLFMALITLESQENHSIQPSELSCALGSSRTNATRIADELEKRGWIERRESDNDRRCLHLQLTEKGHEFLREVLPPQHNCLHKLWSALSTAERDQLEHITRKLLTRLDQMDEDGAILEALR